MALTLAYHAAMLTATVNIAVFAAFQSRVGHVLLSIPQFKPLCALRQLDVSCYGWQKRQDRGKKVATNGKVGGKNGKALMDSGRLHAAKPAVARERDERVYVCMRLFKVLAARGGTVMIELKYH